MGIDRDGDTILDAADTATCSATRIGASGRRHLGLISGLTLLGLAFIRRQGRRQI
jgi:hypothetical protein